MRIMAASLAAIVGIGIGFALAKDADAMRPRARISADSTFFTCERLGAPAMRYHRDLALGGRKPNSSIARVCPECQRKAAELASRWDAEDAAQFEQLANRKCTAELGWRERVPGTCQAGGPPPLCPVDHWVRTSVDDARRRFQRYQDSVRYARQAEMIRAACDCQLSVVTRPPPRDPNPASGAPSQGGFAGLAIPCNAGGTCNLPGSTCVNGYCQLQTPSLLNRPVEQQAKDLYDLYSLAMDAVKGNYASGAIGEFLAPVTTAYELNIYESNATLMEIDLRRLRDVYQEFWRAQANAGQHRSPEMIESEIAALKASVRSRLPTMTLAINGAIVERQLPIGACPDVVRIQHAQLTEHVAAFLSLPDRIATTER